MNRTWIISAFATLALTACGNPAPDTTASAPATENSPASQVAQASPDASGNSTAAGFAELKNVVSATSGAVEANDFTKAQQEFGEFEEYWEKVEDGVKDKSADTYKAIENDLDNVTNGLKAPNPDKAKILADLQSLSKTLNSYQ